MEIDNNKIVTALSAVKDPATGQDIISRRMISELRIQGNQVQFKLATADLPEAQKSSLNFACMEAISAVYPEAEVHIHMQKPDQDAGKQSPLPHVKNIIAVASGKGGVGKSTVAVNLALGLQKLGFRTGLLDADLYGPSAPTMLGLQGQKPKVQVVHGTHKIVPLEAYGMPVMSIGFVVEPEQAVVLRGPRLAGIIKQFLGDTLWPALDYLIIDLPPGTGDIQLTLVQTVPLTGAILVTTPQELAVVDAVKAMNMFMLDSLNVPILGVVENMSWFTPAELPENKYFLFGSGGGAKLADLGNTRLLAQIPLVQSVRECGDNGRPAVLQEDTGGLQERFILFAKALHEQTQTRNEAIAPTRIVEIKEG
ncbi:MAG TPA: Mrp/NBP35 family ATP-binding protein [Saprospiraceae bacterium]|nr:Mrp/NBP35 family ATP-binding protein [Saprospiraceae bacterium]